MNDSLDKEMKNTTSSLNLEEKNYPTPTALVNVYKKEEKQGVLIEGLYVLLDSGCSHSM